MLDITISAAVLAVLACWAGAYAPAGRHTRRSAFIRLGCWLYAPLAPARTSDVRLSTRALGRSTPLLARAAYLARFGGAATTALDGDLGWPYDQACDFMQSCREPVTIGEIAFVVEALRWQRAEPAR